MAARGALPEIKDVDDAVAAVWAKSWPMNEPVEGWLPLWQHLDDAADVAGLLWDDWVAPVTRHLIADALPDGEADGRRLLCWLAGVHDVGKATPAFAVQVPELANAMARAGLRFGPMVQTDRALLRHEIAGAAILDRWLEQRAKMPGSRRRQLTDVVAGHHGSYPELSRVQDAWARPHLIGAGSWDEVQTALLDRASARLGVGGRWAAWRAVRLPQPAQMALTGLVIMADWIASGETFPLLPIHQVPPLGHGPVPSARARDGLRKVALGQRWEPVLEPEDVADRFVDRFPWAPLGPRPVQALAIERAQTMQAPGLMMIEAPMGEGKTEAAFMAAETLAARTGAGGCYVALPTQATSNAMFTRMLAWLERLPDTVGRGSQTVALVHGRSALNDEYRDIRLGGRGRALLYAGDAADGDGGSRGRRLAATVSEWMTGRKRAGLSSFVVGTIDHVLFDALIARHLMLRQLSLGQKVVVIDEVHAADVYMSAFLDRALEWLGAAGSPVILMSATLPPARRTELYLAYERGRRQRAGADPEDPGTVSTAHELLGTDLGYPVIVTSGAAGPDVTVAPRSGRTVDVAVHQLDDDLPTLVALMRDRLRDGGCAVVVRNTVRRAQEAAAALAEEFGAGEVTVAHAQFLAVDRAANDADLIAKFGPHGEGTRRPARHVVVGTQVVEQSLDLDFDLMVTDVAPVDLLLQRMGRLHRHARGASGRPAPVRDAECFVVGVEWATTPPRPERGAIAVYRRWPLLRALAALEPHLGGRPITLPDDIAPLVRGAYAAELEAPAGWAEDLDAAAREYTDAQERRRESARAFLVPPVGRDGRDLYDLSHASVGEVDEESPQGQACVRDGGESLEVVVVQRGADGDRIPDWVPGGGELLPLRHVEPDGRQARTLAGCVLRLPFRLTHPGVIDRVIAELERDRFDGWQRAPFLSGQLALVLDDDGRAEVAGHRLRYDRRRGLVVDDVE